MSTATPIPEAEIEKTCAALVAACEDRTETGWKAYVALHKAAVAKYGDEAIAKTMKKHRLPKE
jgi:hypothetical protein